MSKATSRLLFLVGLGVCLLAIIPLIFGLVGSSTTTTYIGNGEISTQIVSLGNATLFWLAIALFVLGGLTSFVGYVGALVKMAQLEQWIWFILLIVFSGITMLVYIFVGPETRGGSLTLTYSNNGS